MSERILALGTLLAFVVVSILVLWALEIWPFGEEKVNCCVNKMLPNAQCAEITKKQCEKVRGQVVENCEDCLRQVTQGITGGGAASRPMAPP